MGRQKSADDIRLTIQDFDRFFRAVHGCDPFPWQVRLASQILAGCWPDLCDLPTACGKTALIDIWVFLLALDSAISMRSIPMRMIFVVDRRLVIDDAYGRAKLIAGRLRDALADSAPTADADQAVLRAVALRLADLSGTSADRIPLQVAVLRGGLPRDNGWVESVHQPTVVLSTVDQSGSRLLHRGYGIAPHAAPIHAGLLGEDSVFVLDESHLSNPFTQTLRGIAQMRGLADEPIGLPWRTILMSATHNPTDGDVSTFRLDMDSGSEDRAGAPLLDRRLAAIKLARLARAPAAKGLQAQAREFAAIAERLAEQTGTGARTIGIVVNRVRLARRIHDILVERHGAVSADQAQGGSLLLTGRCRPFERDRLLGLNGEQDNGKPFARVIDRIRTGRDRNGQKVDAPLFVVGTQAIEAGADLDFDALVTEIAPWPSLKQRFGRLDRAGVLGETHAVIVCTFDIPKTDALPKDAVYGASGWLTRRWLWTLAGQDGASPVAPERSVDLGVDGQGRLGRVPQGLSPDVANAPALLPSIMDLFAQTDPVPHPSPDPALWLHGPAAGPADVQIVWRADAPAGGDDAESARYAEILASVPPTSAEALPLPLWTARQWLGRVASDAADIVAPIGDPPNETADGADGRPRRGSPKAAVRAAGAPPPTTDEGEIRPASAKVFVWRGAGSEMRPVDDLRPGDTVVLPVSWGGCDRFGWLPEPTEAPAPADDLAEGAILLARGRRVVRLHSRTLEPGAWHEVADVLQGLDYEASGSVVVAAVRTAVPGLLPTDLGNAPDVVPYATDAASLADGVLLIARRRNLPRQLDVRPDLLDEDDLALLATGEVPLDAHQDGVSRAIADATRRVKLRAALSSDTILAGRCHDFGKVEVRFRAMLPGGGLMNAIAMPPLAKGVLPPDRRGRTDMFDSIALPPGARHECWSVAMIQDSPVLAAAHDSDLVLWLVGTHHGRGRPAFVPISDPNPPFDRVDYKATIAGECIVFSGPVRHGLHEPTSGWPDRFFRLIDRYGHWGLAYLEALVRLSDARRSRAEAAEINEVAEQKASAQAAQRKTAA